LGKLVKKDNDADDGEYREDNPYAVHRKLSPFGSVVPVP
jgi:hypothetical protein